MKKRESKGCLVLESFDAHLICNSLVNILPLLLLLLLSQTLFKGGHVNDGWWIVCLKP